MQPKELAELVNSGQLRKIRRGWFATALAPSDVVRAVQLGGRLGCLSGCRAHGLWVPPDRALHVVLNPGHRSTRTDGVVFHRIQRPCHSAVASLEDCLTQVIHRHDAETALVVLESALERKLIDPADAKGLLSAAPAKKRRGIRHLRAGAGSGSETRVRLFLQRRNVQARCQVHIPGVGRVDLLVGRSLIIECDSAAHHSTPTDYEEDRRRDLAARQLGYTVIRLSYHQIWVAWEHTQTALAAEIATRRHMQAPRSVAAHQY